MSADARIGFVGRQALGDYDLGPEHPLSPVTRARAAGAATTGSGDGAGRALRRTGRAGVAPGAASCRAPGAG